MISVPKTMKRTFAGLHQGSDLRAAEEKGLWIAEMRLRDVGEIIGRHTGIYEYSADGYWTAIGSFKTLRLVENAGRALREGTHLVRGAHSTDAGQIPTMIWPFASMADEIRKWTGS